MWLQSAFWPTLLHRMSYEESSSGAVIFQFSLIRTETRTRRISPTTGRHILHTQWTKSKLEVTYKIPRFVSTSPWWCSG
jgi:hypothetical protein